MTARTLVSTAEAAELLGVPAAVIWTWQTRGHVVPVKYVRGRGRGGQAPLWLLEELQPLADAYRPRQRDTPGEPGAGG